MSALSATSRPTRRAGAIAVLRSRRDDCIGALFGALIAIAVLAYVAAAGSTVATFNDFYREALPAYRALAGGHVVGFLRLGPAYVGSLVLRAPFALVPSIWGGGVRAMYFAAALPCVIAAPLFAAWLGAQPRRDGATRNRIGPMLLCVFNPLVLMALFGGHPEEILGAVLCVVGVVLAVRGSVDWAAVLLALAVVNKSSALVAVPVALVLAPAQRGRMLVIMAALVGAVMVPVTLARMVGAGSSDAAVTGATLGTGIGSIFNPPQLLWWFGAGSWIVAHARELIVLSSVLCAGLWWVRRARGLGAARDLRGSAPDGARTAPAVAQGLLLLALVFLLRAAFDPWNNPSYSIPFIFSLLAYEVFADRPPLLTVLYTVLVFVVVPVNGIAHVSDDLQAAAYAAIVLPLIGWMAYTMFVVRVVGSHSAVRGRTYWSRARRADM